MSSTQPTVRKCPKCKNGKLDTRTKRGKLVRTVLFWLPLMRFRCSNCNQKSYVMANAGEK